MGMFECLYIYIYIYIYIIYVIYIPWLRGVYGEGCISIYTKKPWYI